MLTIRKWADRLNDLSAALAALALLVLVVVILIDVAGRAFGRPLYGSQDILTMSLVIVVFGAMALCDRKGGHIAVDILEPHYPRWLNRITDIVSSLLGAVIFAGIAWSVWDSARLSQMLNLSTNLLNLPKAWFQWALCGFASLTAISMLLKSLAIGLGQSESSS